MFHPFIHRLYNGPDDVHPGRLVHTRDLVDGEILNVLSVGALLKLNRFLKKIGQEPVQTSQFNPHLLIDGCRDHEEDYWLTATRGNVRLWFDAYYMMPQVRHKRHTSKSIVAVDLLLLKYRQLCDLAKDTPCFGSRFRVEFLAPGPHQLARGDEFSIGYKTEEAANAA